jgi:hypothetical protein
MSSENFPHLYTVLSAINQSINQSMALGRAVILEVG